MALYFALGYSNVGFGPSRRTVWEILRRMARAAGTKALSQDVVAGVCASLVRGRLDALGRDRIQPRSATWKINWHPTSVRLRWPRGPGPVGTEKGTEIKKSFLVLVTEEATGKAADETSEEDEATTRVLAFRCAHTSDPPSSNETAVQLALYDALVYPLSAGGQFMWHISPPTRLRVQSPMPKAIQQAARMWRIKVEEITQQDCDFLQHQRQQWAREWERGLVDRVFDPVHYLRILDRAFEQEYGYAPFLAKQQAVRQIGWRMFPDNDPLPHCPGLRELLLSFPATVGEDGTVDGQRVATGQKTGIGVSFEE